LHELLFHYEKITYISGEDLYGGPTKPLKYKGNIEDLTRAPQSLPGVQGTYM